MTKIDIFSGFLGAGKTTLIKKLITEAFAGQQVVLIENEFGEIGIDGGFLKESGIQINELNAGCRTFFVTFCRKNRDKKPCNRGLDLLQ